MSPRPSRRTSWPRRSGGWPTAARGSARGWAGGWWAAWAGPELDQLTNGEREVLRLLARGYAYKEIAKELYISIKTVETHVSNVLRKLQMSNRYELSRWAADRRLV